MNPDTAAHYLAGMIDGEGHVSAKARTYLRVTITNTDRDLIDACEEALDALGIAYKTDLSRPAHDRWAPVWVIKIHGRENFQRIADLVPLRSSRKREALQTILSGYRETRAERLARLGPQIIELYEAGLGAPTIAERIGEVSKVFVYSCLREAGVSRRSRSEAASLRCQRAA